MGGIKQSPWLVMSEAPGSLSWELVSWGLHEEDHCYGLNVCVPQILMLKPYPQCNGDWEVVILR